ncbi:MAG: hypothetical protein C5B57_12275 [Blastocatellia bacterium]|nr:MAG: hypothetical protein C5B57_12275 [Blastocatellia bacterium]
MKLPTMSAATVGLLLLMVSGATAQSRHPTTPAVTERPWAAPRTPWGDPDLQAVWSTEDLRDIPYERPDEQAGRLQLTDAEFAARVARAKRDEGRTQTGFANASKTRTFRQTSLIIDGDGKYPRLTAEALRRFRITDIGSYGEGPFLGPEDLNLYDRCITRGIVGSLLPVAYGNGLQIFQTRDAVVINYEMVHETRVIPLDGRAHVGPRIRMYMGDSRGHWDGDTLVVESTNFTNRTSVGRNGYGPHNSQALRLVEKFTRVSKEQIDYEVSVNDPETWIRPFTMAFPLTTQPGYQIFQYECHEGNLMIVQALSGARAEDRAAAEALAKGIPVPPRLPIWEAPEGVQVPR